ncbi:alpha/beta fold hydrolase [Yunchengibacter salinarum]|uniref:alpha/beta fold hydrolase n=1 Tax=Yunchengibacter salinarum TaxID=3133399 RepID=UPI0035B5AF27
MANSKVYGLTIGYDVAGPAAKTPDDPPPLMFLHGWCGDRQSFAEQMAAFKDSHRCIAPDLPGHGQSIKTRIDHGITFLAEVMVGLIKELRLFPPVLVGHSMGGPVAIEMMRQAPDLVRAAVLIDPAMMIHNTPVADPMQRALDAMERDGVKPTFERMIDRSLAAAPEEAALRDWLMESSRRVPGQVAITAWRGMLDWSGPQALGAVAGTGKPLAIINGPNPLNERSAILHRAPNLQWATTLGGGHHPHLTRPGQVNAMLASFLNDEMRGDPA